MLMIESLEHKNNEKENSSSKKPLGFPSGIIIFFKIRSKICIYIPLYCVNKVCMWVKATLLVKVIITLWNYNKVDDNQSVHEKAIRIEWEPARKNDER